jgi:hypothetical protein
MIEAVWIFAGSLELLLLATYIFLWFYSKHVFYNFINWFEFKFWGFWVEPKIKKMSLFSLKSLEHLVVSVDDFERRGTKILYYIRIINNKHKYQLDRTRFSETEFLHIFKPYVGPVRVVKEFGIVKFCKENYKI